MVVLDAGRPIAAGAPDVVRGEAKVREAYLGSGEIAGPPARGRRCRPSQRRCSTAEALKRGL